PARSASTYLLVPKLCLGTQGCEALLRGCHLCRVRSGASRRAFPSRAWERETPMARTTHDALSPTGPQRVSAAVAVARRRVSSTALPARVRAHPVFDRRRSSPAPVGASADVTATRLRPVLLLPPALRPRRPDTRRPPQSGRPSCPTGLGETRY